MGAKIFKPGDGVRLKIGSRNMTVIKYNISKETDTMLVSVTWSHEGLFKTAQFAQDDLTMFPKEHFYITPPPIKK